MGRDEGTLLDIAKAARAILTFVQGLQKEDFLEDFKTQSAVLYQLIVIGEAVKRLSFEWREPSSAREIISSRPRSSILLCWRPAAIWKRMATL
jgi:uncharacterized protein with HEPN domain